MKNQKILNKIIAELGIKNDAALANLLDVAPPVISKLRSNTLKFGPTLIIRTHYLMGWSIAEIKELIGEPPTSAQLKANAAARSRAAEDRYAAAA